MTISQVALSNTFNEFRSTFNDAANTVNSLIPSANAISANTITLASLTSGRVPLVSTAGLIVDDSNLTYNTSTDVLTLGGATDASSTTTGTLIVTGGVGVAKKLYVGTDLAVTANTTLSGTTDSSSSTTGAVIISGGLGVAKKLYVGTDLSVAGNATFTGNVTILGSNSEISTTQINVNDPLIQLANNNTSNTVDIGLFGQYNSGSANVYSGVFRDASDGIWKFFKDYTVEPGTTIDPAANGFSYANVSIGALSTANNISIGTGQAYQINGANVLSSTVLGSTVVTSSLTTVGTIGSGVWQGTVITPTYGGTGVTSSTGTGSVVLSTSPSLTTPALGTPASGTLSSCTVDGTDAVGFRNIPINSKSAAYTTVLADSGKVIFHPSTDANARTFTIDSNANVAYPLGTAITFINMTSQVVTIAITTDTMYLAKDGTTGSRSLAQYGSATAIKMTSTTWLISGSALT